MLVVAVVAVGREEEDNHTHSLCYKFFHCRLDKCVNNDDSESDEEVEKDHEDHEDLDDLYLVNCNNEKEIDLDDIV